MAASSVSRLHTPLLKRFSSKLKNFGHLKITRTFSSSLLSSQITYKTFGDPRLVLEKNEVEIPTDVDKNEVKVKMLMAPVNPSDINMIEGTYFIRPPLPAVVGNEGVGEIIQVGDDVTDLHPGDWIIPDLAGLGTWRNYIIAPRSSVLKIENNIPIVNAATLLVNPPTAYRMLTDYVQLEPGDIVMQNGANSSVGQCVIQLAKQWNLITVNMVRDRPDIVELKRYLKDLGADYVITEEFCRSPEMKDFIKSLPSQPRLSLNCVGGKSAAELMRYLGQGGCMVTYGGMSRKPIVVPTGALLFKEIKLEGYWNTEWNKRQKDSIERVDMYKDLCRMIRNGQLQHPTAEYFLLDEFQRAVSDSLDGFKSSKKILVMDEDLL